jgi:hypothetical protein
MASSGKRKTTMAKLNREGKLRERRMEKLARKEARKLRAATGEPEESLEETPEALEPDEPMQLSDRGGLEPAPAEKPAA